MNFVTSAVIKVGILKQDLDYQLIRASMVIIFLLFGYQKWFDYEAQVLIPYISNGPLLSWMYPVFGVHGATYFLGVSEWSLGALLLAGVWNKKLGIHCSWGAFDHGAGAVLAGKTPLDWLGRISDIALLAVFLSSDESGWITGEVDWGRRGLVVA
jgi:hypothetical protein